MSHFVGTVDTLWRYPVKSMAGESIETGHIEKKGLFADRLWATRDEKADELTSVRKHPKLLQCKARFTEEPGDSQIPSVIIELPDGTTFNSRDDSAPQKLSDYLGCDVTLWPQQPRSNWRHYRLKTLSGEAAMKKQFASKHLPDMSSISWAKMLELSIFSTPLGRYYDCYPLHILTSNALTKLSELEPEGHFIPQRFRPNIFINSAESKAHFDEFDWLDGRLMIGDSIIHCESRTIRCSMPAQPQNSEIKKNAKVLRTLEQHTGRHMGINATVIKPGRINIGDKVYWQPGQKSLLGKAIAPHSARLKTRLIHSSLKAIDRIGEKKSTTK